jgi:hypothetical protein
VKTENPYEPPQTKETRIKRKVKKYPDYNYWWLALLFGSIGFMFYLAMSNR